MSEETTTQMSSRAEPAQNAEQEIKGRVDGVSQPEEQRRSHGAGERKRKKGGGRSRPYEYGKRKKSRKDGSGGEGGRMKNERRRGDDDWEDQPPHEGSYASPAMQELFGLNVKAAAQGKVDSSVSGESGDRNCSPAPATLAGGVATESDATLTLKEHGIKDDGVKHPKRKVALFIAFVGEAYSGMQINKDQRTIQAELELALFKGGFLSESNFGFPHKYGWSNSARTDKGVHSCAQVCSVKINLPPVPLDEVREAINSELPKDIRVLDVVKTTRNFCAKTQRDKVRYQYMFPSFMLHERDSLRKLFEAEGCPNNGRNASDPLSTEEIESLRPALKKYRASADVLERLRVGLAMFKGTHPFHNYTNGKTSDDPSSSRYIISFDVQETTIGEDGLEWIPTQVVGQSFLLHQIRKMISMAIDFARGAATADSVRESLSKRQMRLGIAPAQGLFLDMSFFDGYNRRNVNNDPLDWVKQESPAVERWKEFKEKTVMRHVMEEEARRSNFLKYLFVQEFSFDRENYGPLGESTQKNDGDNPVRNDTGDSPSENHSP